MTLKRKIKIITTIAIIATTAAYLLYSSISSSVMYYYTVDEFFAAGIDNIHGDTAPQVRLAGIVKAGTLTVSGDKSNFELAGKDNFISVSYGKTAPVNLKENAEVLVEGTMGTDTFVAENILTLCESKYKAKLKKSLSE